LQLVAIILIAVGALVLGVVGWLLQYFLRLVTNLFLSISIEGSKEDYGGPPSERVSFPAADGARIGGLLAKATGVQLGTVIFCSEFGATAACWAKYVGWLVEEGWNVLALDFRREGICPDGREFVPRIWVTNRELADIEGAIDWVKSRPDSNGRLALMGISRGATAALVAASVRREVDAVISDGGFSTRRTLLDYMRRWVSIYAWVPLIYEHIPGWFYRWLAWSSIAIAQLRAHVKFLDVRKSVAGIRAPVLFIHGEKDSYIAVDEARALHADCCTEHKELWVVPHCRHNQASIVAADEYRRRVSAFLARQWAGLAGPVSTEVSREP